LGTYTILLILILLFFLLLALECPVAFALATVGAAGILLTTGFTPANSTLAAGPYNLTSRYTLVVIPMYILLGMFALHGGIADQVYEVVHAFTRRLPGGLGVATVMASAGFAAVTGSTVATAATMGRIAVGKMAEYGYPRSFAAAIVGASGTLGALIPPSIILVVYAIISEQSIAALLLAGVIPGLISAVIYSIYIVFAVHRAVRKGKGWGERPSRDAGARGDHVATDAGSTHEHEDAGGPRVPLSVTVSTASEQVREKNRGRGLLRRRGSSATGPRERLPYRGPVRALIIFGIVVGGLYGGLFTATESGGLGASVALAMLLWERRRGYSEPLRKVLGNALRESASLTSMVFIILVGSGVFAFYLVSAGIPADFTRFILALDVPPLLIVAVLLLAMIPLGMALDSLSILVITVPLTFPVVTALGFDGIWFGILVVKMVELGLITPPVGINVFVVAGAAGDVSVEETFRQIAPFGVLDVLTTALLFAFPSLILWLPTAFGLL
jgi:TRAP-type C4-dicarboxylate transport system permease large subunit